MLSQISRKNLVAMGTMLGRITHSGKFKLTVHALPVIAQHAKFKVWVKPSAEMSFLYGNHVLKSGLGRITENTPAYQVRSSRGASGGNSIAPHSAVWGWVHGRMHVNGWRCDGG